MTEQAPPQLGDEVEDTITGFRGTVTGYTKWLTGCDTVQIQPRVDKEGKVPEPRTADVPVVRVTKHKGEAVNPTPRQGGPRSLAPRQR